MAINREPESIEERAVEDSAVRRTPVDLDDAYELQDHEFTLEPEDPPSEASWPSDEHTAPWSTLPPLPAWASHARALLEPPTVPASTHAHYDDMPTPVHQEIIPCSPGELRALREELAASAREANALQAHAEDLERSLDRATRALADAERRREDEGAAQAGRIDGQAFRIADLEASVRELQAALSARSDDAGPRAAAARPARKRIPTVRDDLQQIEGIGKRFAERLNELGIRTFAQVAKLGPGASARVADQLGITTQRIAREGWIKQARKLQAKSTGTRPRR